LRKSLQKKWRRWTSICLSVSVSVCVCLYACLCLCIWVCMDVCIYRRMHSYVYTQAYAIIGIYTYTYTHTRTPARTYPHTQTSAGYFVPKVSGEQSECGRRGTSVRAHTHRHTQLTATLRCRWYSRKCLLRFRKSSSRRFQVFYSVHCTQSLSFLPSLLPLVSFLHHPLTFMSAFSAHTALLYAVIKWHRVSYRQYGIG
jgi:hypothetical protein